MTCRYPLYLTCRRQQIPDNTPPHTSLRLWSSGIRSVTAPYLPPRFCTRLRRSTRYHRHRQKRSNPVTMKCKRNSGAPSDDTLSTSAGLVLEVKVVDDAVGAAAAEAVAKEFPEGGMQAWMTVAGAYVFMVLCFLLDLRIVLPVDFWSSTQHLGTSLGLEQCLRSASHQRNRQVHQRVRGLSRLLCSSIPSKFVPECHWVG
jgi:hypothetical protein